MPDEVRAGPTAADAMTISLDVYDDIGRMLMRARSPMRAGARHRRASWRVGRFM